MQALNRPLSRPLPALLSWVPLGLLAMSVVFDLIGVLSGSPSAHGAAYWALSAALVGVFAAVPSAFVERGAAAGDAPLLGLAGAALLLFLVSWLLRDSASTPPLAALLCAWAASALALLATALSESHAGQQMDVENRLNHWI